MIIKQKVLFYSKESILRLFICIFTKNDVMFKLGDDLGAVECNGVALADLPHQLEHTRVFALTLAGNGLRKFPVGKLRDMGELI